MAGSEENGRGKLVAGISLGFAAATAIVALAIEVGSLRVFEPAPLSSAARTTDAQPPTPSPAPVPPPRQRATVVDRDATLRRQIASLVQELPQVGIGYCPDRIADADRLRRFFEPIARRVVLEIQDCGSVHDMVFADSEDLIRLREEIRRLTGLPRELGYMLVPGFQDGMYFDLSYREGD